MKLFAYIFTAILCLSFSQLPISAQKFHPRDNRDRRPFHHNKHSSFSQEEFKKQKEAYFVRTIPLSPEEAQTVLAGCTNPVGSTVPALVEARGIEPLSENPLT